MAATQHYGAFLFGAVLGAVGGALATMMLTPRSGQELREEIVERGRDVEQKARMMSGDLKSRSKDLVDQGRDLTGGSPADVTEPAEPTGVVEVHTQPETGSEAAAEVTIQVEPATPETASAEPEAVPSEMDRT